MFEHLYSDNLEERKEALKKIEELSENNPKELEEKIPELLKYLRDLPYEDAGLRIVAIMNEKLVSAHFLIVSKYKEEFSETLKKFAEQQLSDNGIKSAIAIQLLSILRPILSSNPKLYDDFLPIIFDFMRKEGTVQQVAYSLIATLPTTKPKILSPYVPQIFELIKNGFSQLTLSLFGLYSLNPEAFENNLDVLKEIYERNPNYRSMILNIFYEISKKKPEKVVPFISVFKEGLMSPNTSSQSAMILAEIARSYPKEVYPIVPQLEESAQYIDHMKMLVPNILGLIAQLGDDVAKEILPFLADLLKGADQNLAVSVLSEFKNIADMNQELVRPYEDLIRSYTNDPQEYVRDMAKAIIAKLEGRDLEALHDKILAQNEEIKRVVQSYDDLKEYIDNNISILKEFIADIVKKLPVPVAFSVEGKIRKTLTLYFTCGTQSERCLFPSDRPFKTETKAWNKWLKVAFSAVKIGKAVIQPVSAGDAIKAVKEAYDAFKTEYDEDFLAYIKEPFLTSQEQDDLINQLREAKFFDVFNYNPQTGTWDCIMCYQPTNK